MNTIQREDVTHCALCLDKITIRQAQDIKTVEFGWPVGMPVCKPLGGGIYEVRSSLAQNRIGQMLFYGDKSSCMVSLHGFTTKTQKTRRGT